MHLLLLCRGPRIVKPDARLSITTRLVPRVYPSEVWCCPNCGFKRRSETNLGGVQSTLGIETEAPHREILRGSALQKQFVRILCRR